MRDGLSGMVIGRVSSYIDLEVVKQLHIDRGIIRKVHTLDQNSANIIDSVEAFESTLESTPESAVILFAFDENYIAQFLTSDQPGQDCCVVQVQRKEYPVSVEEAINRKKRLIEKLSMMRKTCLLRIIQI